MDFEPLPFDANLDEFQRQAERLLEGWFAADSDAVQLVRNRHPRFLDESVRWLPRKLTEEQAPEGSLDLTDARLALARAYDFRDWPALEEFVKTVAVSDSPVWRFEAAVERVIYGDETALADSLDQDPDLVRARSSRITGFDPPAHRATLLHYVAANGVEQFRQKTPPNAVAIARLLLQRGAEPDALAEMYGAQCTPMSMLVSSDHPAKAGLQAALVDTLLDFGAAVDGQGSRRWGSPLVTALIFDSPAAADVLCRRGACIDLVAAAGLGRVEDACRLLPGADGESRHRALVLAAMHGQAEIVRLLLDAGEDANRYNPLGFHAHSTPLHQAVWRDQESVVRLLVERGARLDLRDTVYQSTPLGWAEYGGRAKIADYLRAQPPSSS